MNRYFAGMASQGRGCVIVCPVCFNAKQFDKDGLRAPIAAITPAGSGSGGVCIWEAGGRSALMRNWLAVPIRR